MSSDILLQELEKTLEGVEPGYLTKKVPSVSSADEVNSLLVKEQVRLSSLRRQQDLALKLAADLPARIAKIEAEAKSVEESSKALLAEEKAREQKLRDARKKREEIESEMRGISRKLQEKRVSDSISNLQKDQLWSLISRVVDVRKSLVSALDHYNQRSLKDESDFEYLRARIERNEELIQEIESKLTLIGQ
jgi:hypothetical protein